MILLILLGITPHVIHSAFLANYHTVLEEEKSTTFGSLSFIVDFGQLSMDYGPTLTLQSTIDTVVSLNACNFDYYNQLLPADKSIELVLKEMQVTTDQANCQHGHNVNETWITFESINENVNFTAKISISNSYEVPAFFHARLWWSAVSLLNLIMMVFFYHYYKLWNRCFNHFGANLPDYELVIKFP